MWFWDTGFATQYISFPLVLQWEIYGRKWSTFAVHCLYATQWPVSNSFHCINLLVLLGRPGPMVMHIHYYTYWYCWAGLVLW